MWPFTFGRTNEVVADFLELIQAGFEGVWTDDYVVWCLGRIVAVIHQPMDGREQKVFLFNEERNDPIAGRVIEPMPFWPTLRRVGRRRAWRSLEDRAVSLSCKHSAVANP